MNRRSWFAATSVVGVVAGFVLVVGHEAHAQARSAPVVVPTANAATSKAVVCNATVELGSTTACDLPAFGGTARYSFTVPAADTIRLRAVTPGAGEFFHTITLRKSNGTLICTQSTVGGIDCPVPSAGGYRVDVTFAFGATVYTTVDGVLADDCSTTLDLAIGAPGADVDITEPGASWCRAIADAPPGSILELTIDSNGFEGLDVSVYDSAGAQLCSADVVARERFTCEFVGDGAGYRLFATPAHDGPQDAVLIVSRVSHPSGCQDRRPDAFGRAASRRGMVAPRQQQCFLLDGLSGHGVGLHLFGAPLTWAVRTDAGAEVCTGTAGGRFYPLTACTLPSDDEYAVFVSDMATQPKRFVLSLVDMSSGAGCTPVASTAWGAAPSVGTLSGSGQVDCRTFTATAGEPVRVALFEDSARALLTTLNGALLCAITFPNQECTVPVTGTYRLIVSAVVRTSVPYRVWTIGTATTAGCTPTTPDVFGSAPTRTADFDSDTLQVCYTFDAPADSAYHLTVETVSGDVFGPADIRTTDGERCTVSMCPITDAGTYLLVVSLGARGEPPVQGSVAVGLWRGDVPAPGCVYMGTSFTSAPVSGTLDGPAQADCHAFGGETGTTVLVRTNVFSDIFDRDGHLLCSFLIVNTCRLNGTGPFRVVTSRQGSFPQPYRLRIASVSRPHGCLNLAATPFGQAPSRPFTITDSLDLHCYALPVPSGTGEIGIRTVGVPHSYPFSVTVYRPNGTASCTIIDELATCPTPTAGTYLAVVSDDNPASGRLGWYDLTGTAGCTTGPTLAFGEPATTGTISARGEVDCLTVPLQAHDVPRLAVGPTASGAVFVSRLLRSEPAGARILVFADDAQSRIRGPYALHAWRLNDPIGCTDAGSLHDPLGPLVGSLADRNDEACYLVAARAGTESITTSNDVVPEDVPLVELIGMSGTVRCSVQGTGSCQLQPGDYSLIVRRGNRPQDVDFAGTYRVEGTCTHGTCGP